jgi:hypothetical protein
MSQSITQPAAVAASAALDHAWLARSKSQGRDGLDAQARKFVSQVFFGNILRQLRQSPFQTNLMGIGSGGRGFQTILDQEMANRMANAAPGRCIAQSVVRRMSRNSVDPQTPLSLDEARRTAAGGQARRPITKRTAAGEKVDEKG